MNFHNFLKRLAPVTEKLAGKLPDIPWPTVLEQLRPSTLGYHYWPMNIETVAEEEGMKLLRFNGTVEVWLPTRVRADEILWREFYSVFDDRPNNYHYYLIPQTPIHPGDIVIDCGACEGFFILQALERGAGKVVAVEANATLLPCLHRTLSNAMDKVIIEHAAVGALNGNVRFDFDPENPAGGKICSEGVEVPMKTIDQIVEELCLPKVDFIKMDIEGAEIQATEGALGVLERYHPRVAIATYHRVFDFVALRAILRSVGYKNILLKGITSHPDRRPMMIHAW